MDDASQPLTMREAAFEHSRVEIKKHEQNRDYLYLDNFDLNKGQPVHAGTVGWGFNIKSKNTRDALMQAQDNFRKHNPKALTGKQLIASLRRDERALSNNFNALVTRWGSMTTKEKSAWRKMYNAKGGMERKNFLYVENNRARTALISKGLMTQLDPNVGNATLDILVNQSLDTVEKNYSHIMPYMNYLQWGVIADMNFNGPKLVNKSTNFYKNLSDQAKKINSDIDRNFGFKPQDIPRSEWESFRGGVSIEDDYGLDWHRSIWEVYRNSARSGGKFNQGLQNRRNQDAENLVISIGGDPSDMTPYEHKARQ